MKFIVIDVQGFFANDNFQPKELAIFDGKQMVNYFLKSERPFHCLSEDEKQQVRYLEYNHHCLQYNGGNVEMSELDNIFTQIIQDVDVIYVKGLVKKNFLFKRINCEMMPLILNLENISPNLLKSKPDCMNHNFNKKCMCAVSNCIQIHNYILSCLPYE